MAESMAESSKEVIAKPRRNDPRDNYEQVFVWRADFARIRELEYHWHRSRVAVIHALLNMAPASALVRPVSLPAISDWQRLEELSHQVHVPLDELLSRLILLVSRCSADEAMRFIAPPDPE